MLLSPTQQMVYRMYKDQEGNPLRLTDGQDFLFRAIYGKTYPRWHVMNHTRYGKSLDVALAVLSRCVVFPEKWAIIAGEKEKARIIMGYVISHIFDNKFTANRFVPDKGESADEVRRYKSKNHLTFVINPEERDPTKRLLSEITIGSAKDALGYGAPNVIEDESALIEDEEHALVMRMLGDDPNKNFLVKIGNPFRRNHFLRSFEDPLYRKIVIDCYRSLKDGRITQALIDEMRKEAFFSILYECKFPRENEVNEKGYMQLLVKDDIVLAQQRKVEPAGRPRLGVDVAKGGRNFNAWVLRGDNYARVLGKNSEENSVKIANQTFAYMQTYGVIPQAVFIDDTGVGHGVVSVLKERNLPVNAVNFGEKAVNDRYLNLRAQVFAGEYGVMTWIKQGAQLLPSDEWNELLRVKFRKNTGNRTQIEPKEDLIKRGELSPDISDALALTFAKRKINVYTNIIAQPAMQQRINDRPFGGVEKFIEGVG